MELKSFTYSDWSGWAGATHFTNGNEPLIGEHDNTIVIIDGNGISTNTIDIETGDVVMCTLWKGIISSEAMGRMLWEGLALDLSKLDHEGYLVSKGFERIL